MSIIKTIFDDREIGWLPGRPKLSPGFSFIALLWTAAILWGLVRFAAWDDRRREEAKRREASVASALATFGAFVQQHQKYPDTESLAEPLYIKGRVVVIGVGKYQVQWTSDDDRPRGSYRSLEAPAAILEGLYFELPEAIRARTPDEVQTRLMVQWDRRVVGRYSPSNTEAYQLHCDLTIVDQGTNMVVGRRRFDGGMPPFRLPQGRCCDYGPLPLAEIVQYVAGLPRR